MFRNLEAEMTRKGISRQDLAELIGVSYNTARNKIKGNNRFFFDEAYKIKEELFPEYSLEYLFESYETNEENQIN